MALSSAYKLDVAILIGALFLMLFRIYIVAYFYYGNNTVINMSVTSQIDVPSYLCWHPRRGDIFAGVEGRCFDIPPHNQGTFNIGSSQRFTATWRNGRHGNTTVHFVTSTENTKMIISPSAPRSLGEAEKSLSITYTMGWLAHWIMHPPLQTSAPSAEPYTTFILTAAITLYIFLHKKYSPLKKYSLREFLLPSRRISELNTHHLVKLVCVVSMVVEHYGKCFDQESPWYRLLSPPTAVLFYYLIGATKGGNTGSTSLDHSKALNIARVMIVWIFLHYVIQVPLHSGTMLTIGYIMLPAAERAMRWLLGCPLFIHAIIVHLLCYVQPLLGDGLKLSYGSRVILFFGLGFYGEVSWRRFRAPQKGDYATQYSALHCLLVKLMWWFGATSLHLQYIHLSELLPQFYKGQSWVNIYPLTISLLALCQPVLTMLYRYAKCSLSKPVDKIIVWVSQYALEIFIVHLTLIKIGILAMGIPKCTGTY